jgi:peptide/nickel transport system substrate-binding protein
MPPKNAPLRDRLKETRTVPLFERVSGYLSSLSPGDKVIVSVLGGLVVVSSVMSVYTLEQKLLVEEPAYGGTLTEGVVGSPRFVNPLLALSDSDRDLTALTYAGLMGEDGTGALVPVLAESYTTSSDGKTYTFTIRKDAKFSDGSPVTADDVVFTIEKAEDPALKSPEYANWSGIAVRAIDGRTVEFTLSKTYAPFIENTTLGILPLHLWKGVADDEFPFSTLNTQPVGAGPFSVSSVSRDKSGIVSAYDLSANKYYVLGRPYLAGIHFTFFSDMQDLTAALKDGQVDSAYGIPGTGALTAPYSRVFGVFFNPNQNPAFARLEVRKALSVVINRDHIVNDVLGGFASPLMGPVPPGSGVPDIPLPDPTTRIADAAKILQNAGWTYDGTVRAWKLSKSNLSLSFTLRTSNVPELKAVASAVKADWESLGVPVSIELYEAGDLTQNVIRPRKYDALLFGMVIGRDRDLYAFWDSAERNDPGLNIALYANKDVDALLEKARVESDPVAVSEDVAKINTLVAADYPAAFTHAPDFLYTVPKSLHGVMLPQVTAPSDRFATVANWYLQTEKVWPFFAHSR